MHFEPEKKQDELIAEIKRRVKYNDLTVSMSGIF